MSAHPRNKTGKTQPTTAPWRDSPARWYESTSFLYHRKHLDPLPPNPVVKHCQAQCIRQCCASSQSPADPCVQDHLFLRTTYASHLDGDERICLSEPVGLRETPRSVHRHDVAARNTVSNFFLRNVAKHGDTKEYRMRATTYILPGTSLCRELGSIQFRISPYLYHWCLHQHLDRPLDEFLVALRHAVAVAQGQVKLTAGLAWEKFEVCPPQGSLPKEVATPPYAYNSLFWRWSEQKHEARICNIDAL